MERIFSKKSDLLLGESGVSHLALKSPAERHPLRDLKNLLETLHAERKTQHITRFSANDSRRESFKLTGTIYCNI